MDRVALVPVQDPGDVVQEPAQRARHGAQRVRLRVESHGDAAVRRGLAVPQLADVRGHRPSVRGTPVAHHHRSTVLDGPAGGRDAGLFGIRRESRPSQGRGVPAALSARRRRRRRGPVRVRQLHPRHVRTHVRPRLGG